MEIECCCREQPISNQKIIFTAISLDAHNDNIRFPSKNSASGYYEADIGLPQSIRPYCRVLFAKTVLKDPLSSPSLGDILRAGARARFPLPLRTAVRTLRDEMDNSLPL